MGFAKYHEDIVSRFNNDNFRSAYASLPAARQSSTHTHCTDPVMDKLKEFTIASARPLPVIVLADISGSMLEHGKIQSLNHAVREMLEAFRDEDDLRAEIHVAVITFGKSEARVHLPLTSASQATWTEMPAAGNTPMGLAFDAVRQMVEDKILIPGRAYRPTIVLVTDGQPTDGTAWKDSLDALLASERGGKAFRMAMGIGPDADQNVLRAFLADPNGKVYQAQEARDIRKFFQFLTMSVTNRSRNANPNVASQPLDDQDF